MSTSSTISSAIGGESGFNDLRQAISEYKRVSVRGTVCNFSNNTTNSVSFRALLPEDDKLVYYIMTIRYQNGSFSCSKATLTVTAVVDD
jgi:hypothetical protein